MDADPNKDEGSSHGKEDSLPVGKTSPANDSKQPLYLQIPTDLQEQISGALQRAYRHEDERNIKDPIRVEIVKDEELTRFEKKTVRFGYWGVVIASCSLIAACVAAWMVFQQFKEMATQSDLLSRAAEQARKDSNENAKVVAKQLSGLQAQITAAQQGARALQGQLAESRSVVESQRADISVSPYSVDHPMTFASPQQMSFAFTIALTNNGAFAANDVRMRYKLIFPQFDKSYFTEPGKQQRDLCKPPVPPIIGHMPKLSIYSGRAAPEQINGGWGIEAKDTYTIPADPTHSTRISPVVIGCIDYLSGVMPKWHQTGFIFEIRRKDMRGIVPGNNIPSDAILIDRYIFDQGNSY
ncbi:MAG: hypothetical protein KGM96_00320 [Acidobacteriota bacterium]|nr:hypothetical protein [Acidobacteriota bacterium]